MIEYVATVCRVRGVIFSRDCGSAILRVRSCGRVHSNHVIVNYTVPMPDAFCSVSG